MKISQPLECSDSRQKAVRASSGDHEAWQIVQTPADGIVRDGEGAASTSEGEESDLRPSQKRTDRLLLLFTSNQRREQSREILETNERASACWLDFKTNKLRHARTSLGESSQ